MKRKILIVLALTILMTTGCGNKNINLDNVYKNLEDEYKDFVKIDNEIISGSYGVSTDEFNSVLVVMKEDSTTAKMYAVFEAKDNFDDALYEAKYFVDQYKKSWLNGYFPEEEALVKDGELETYGNYIIYVVNENPEDIINLIKKS